MFFLSRLHDKRRLLREQFVQVGRHATADDGEVSSHWAEQLEDLREQVVHAVEIFEDGRRRVAATATELLGLVGAVHSTTKAVVESLHHLRRLGVTLEEERARLTHQRHREKQARFARELRSHSRRVRAWAEVDTSSIVRQTTRDPELILAFCAPPPTPTTQVEGEPPESVGDWEWGSEAEMEEEGEEGGGGKWVVVQEAKTKSKAKAKPKAKAKAAPFADLVHGGPEGAYGRCPLTGRWINFKRPCS